MVCGLHENIVKCGAIKPSLLKCHLDTNHADKMNQDQSYLQRLGENVKRQSRLWSRNQKILQSEPEIWVPIQQT